MNGDHFKPWMDGEPLLASCNTTDTIPFDIAEKLIEKYSIHNSCMLVHDTNTFTKDKDEDKEEYKDYLFKFNNFYNLLRVKSIKISIDEQLPNIQCGWAFRNGITFITLCEHISRINK